MTPYHPQGDGIVERANRTLQNVLKIFVNGAQNNWDEQLPTTMLAYNTSVHSATGFTPCYLMFSREAHMPLHVLCPLPAGTLDCTRDEYTADLVKCLQAAYVTVRGQLDTGERASKQHDRQAKAKPFEIGDHVLLHRHVPPQVSPKHFQYWSGLWEIVSKATDVTYKIEPRFESAVRHRATTVHRNGFSTVLPPLR